MAKIKKYEDLLSVNFKYYNSNWRAVIEVHAYEGIEITDPIMYGSKAYYKTKLLRQALEALPLSLLHALVRQGDYNE